MNQKNNAGSELFWLHDGETGDADAMISGLSKNYPDTIRPALQIIGIEEGTKKVAGMYILMTKRGPIFLADTTVNFKPHC